MFAGCCWDSVGVRSISVFAGQGSIASLVSDVGKSVGTVVKGGGRAHEHSTEDRNNRNTKTGANQQSNNRNQVNEGDEQ